MRHISLVLVLVALAGCLGGGATPTPDVPATESAPSTTTPADTATGPGATPTATDTATATSGTTTATPASTTATATATPTPTLTPIQAEGVRMSITDVTKCGRTCREVTYTVENSGEKPVRDLSVNITMTSGETTIWTGERTFGDVAPGETRTVTERVDLTQEEALTVVSNDRRVTITAVFTSASGSETVSFERQF